ncbi:MAG: TfoX/Sxy family protein [Bacteroidia bacterium]
MAYDNFLADRIGNHLKRHSVHFESKEMMGGLCYMVDDKMCIGIIKNELMARIGEKLRLENEHKPGCRQMDFTGKPMKDYVFVSPDAIDREDDLAFWLICVYSLTR